VQYHEYHEIQNNAHSLDHRLGIDWRAGLHSVKLSIKPFGVLAAGYSANALDIAGRICGPTVPLGIPATKIYWLTFAAIAPGCVFD
jgi:hypothetical protein